MAICSQTDRQIDIDNPEFNFCFKTCIDNQCALHWTPNAYRNMLMRIFTPSLYFQCVFHDFQCVITLLRALSVALYDELSADYIGYLQRQKSKEADREVSDHILVAEALRSRVTIALLRLSPLEPRHSTVHKHKSSRHSESTRRSSSGLSTVVIKHSAKVEEAKVKLLYAQQEAELIRKEAEIKAERSILKVKEEIDVAESNFQTVKRALSFSSVGMSIERNSSILTPDRLRPRSTRDSVKDDIRSGHLSVTSQRTAAFVLDQAKHTIAREKSPKSGVKHDKLSLTDVYIRKPTCVVDEKCRNQASHATQPRHSPISHCDEHSVTSAYIPKPLYVVDEKRQFQASHATQPRLSPISHNDKQLFTSAFIPKPPCEVEVKCRDQAGFVTSPRLSPIIADDKHSVTSVCTPIPPPVNIECQELAKFMVKKDLLTSRLTTFDDKPEHYTFWRTSFLSIMSELDASPLEHLDLLVKSLGPNSKQQAMNICCANPSNLPKAVELIWERLDDRYGSPEMLEAALPQRIKAFPKLYDSNRAELYELSDLVAEIDSVKSNESYQNLFAYFDSSAGVNLIVNKLPGRIQEKWTNEANKYKQKYCVSYPPFSVFCSFMRNIAKMKNDPGFIYEQQQPQGAGKGSPRRFAGRAGKVDPRKQPQLVYSRKTDVDQKDESKSAYTGAVCPIHHTGHTLNKCRVFRLKPLSEREDFVRENGYCFKCCGPKKHRSKRCKEVVKCDVCKSSDHPSALHPDSVSDTVKQHEGERTDVKTVCTEICETPSTTHKSCARILLVNIYPEDKKWLSRRVYCLLDDQSNRSLATSNLFDTFGNNSQDIVYKLDSCAGQVLTAGRRATGYVVESLDSSVCFKLPELVECNNIPNNRDEIPSPAVAEKYSHLQDIAAYIPPHDEHADIELLIGLDLIEAFYVLEDRVGKPYAQRLPLGWVMFGSVCLGKVHGTEVVSVNKINVLRDGRPTLLEPCDKGITVEEDPIFGRTHGDEKPGLSIEDRVFMDIVETKFTKDTDGHWMAPLPFKPSRPLLQNNRPLAVRRAKSLDMSIARNSVKREHVIDFMRKLLENQHAELAPEIPLSKERWYLPLFGVYHPMKPEKIRMVFDSSARYHDVSLNDVLLKGPDLCNSLLGILLRFRREAVAVTMDVEQMFYNFKVTTDHRDFLRFLWHAGNDPEKPLVEYRMTVQVFGNSPSPAIATYGLRKSVEGSGHDVKELVSQNFYVDDGLLSCPDEDGAIELVHRTKRALQEGGGLRLHKFASNSRKVLDSFESDDLASDFKDLDLGDAPLPMQRSLGLLWNTDDDVFTFQVSRDIKPYTKRGVLSTINSLYDPVGFASPVIIRGKLLLRDGMTSTQKLDWDDPLPDSLRNEWQAWVQSLTHLEDLHIQRKYSSISFSRASTREVHVFCDASKDAIGAVAYLKLGFDDSVDISFLLGKAKVTPAGRLTIPRAELCAAVLAVELADTIKEQLMIDPDSFFFYTDSQVVLGYITNETRRFYVFVGNRVSRIRLSSKPAQWKYVQSNMNPADLATRSVDAKDLQDCTWLKGPKFLKSDSHDSGLRPFPMVDPDSDKEVRPEVRCYKTEEVDVYTPRLGSHRFESFSDWKVLVRSTALLKYVARLHGEYRESDLPDSPKDPDFLRETERFLIQTVQGEVYKTEIEAIRGDGSPPRNSSLLTLAPVLDQHGLLRVGGRLGMVEDGDVVSDLSRHPIILPKHHHISSLIVRHFHQKICHQGRHLTDGAIRAAGFWIVGGKQLVSSQIAKCVFCRKSRGQRGWQFMADLPEDRLTPAPPFSYVGVDTFGP